MDEFAKSIGWTVIVIVIIYVVGKSIIASGEQKDKENNSILHRSDIELRLSYRNIYRSTTDDAIRNLVKAQYGAWYLLRLELDDDQYNKMMTSGEARMEFNQAVKNIEAHGDALRLVDGRIVGRTAQ